MYAVKVQLPLIFTLGLYGEEWLASYIGSLTPDVKRSLPIE